MYRFLQTQSAYDNDVKGQIARTQGTRGIYSGELYFLHSLNIVNLRVDLVSTILSLSTPLCLIFPGPRFGMTSSVHRAALPQCVDFRRVRRRRREGDPPRRPVLSAKHDHNTRTPPLLTQPEETFLMPVKKESRVFLRWIGSSNSISGNVR